MERWNHQPTDEEMMRMRAAEETRQKKKDRLDRELLTQYDNWNCALCHKASWTQVICRKHGGSICMKHCKDCVDFSRIFQHCLYHEPEKPWTEWAKAESMGDLLQVLTMKTRRDCVLGEMDDDCAYRVIDEKTGKIARGVVRFFEGAWHYGAYEKTA